MHSYDKLISNVFFIKKFPKHFYDKIISNLFL